MAEYGEIFISPYSVRMRENTDQKNSVYGHLLRNVGYLAVEISIFIVFVKSHDLLMMVL